MTEEEYSEDSSALTEYSVLPYYGEKTIALTVYPGTPYTELIMTSPFGGNWKFETKGSPISFSDCAKPSTAVSTYWKDESNPNNPWNFFPGGGMVCYPTSVWSSNLYSGSSNISYKFVYAQYEYYGQTVYAKFTKL
jgi:hypothetical protein